MRTSLLAGMVFLSLALPLTSVSFAQEWEPVGSASFVAIASAEDGSLLLVRYPGDILRSTDSGARWSEVYHGGLALTGFGCPRDAPGEIDAYADTSGSVVSLDSGRTWQAVHGEWRSAYDATLHSVPYTLYPFPPGTNSVGYADSAWWAVGDPGMICVWDRSLCRWCKLHRSPFSTEPGAVDTSRRLSWNATVHFYSAAHGAIAIGNRIFVTNDSAATWNDTVLPDTAGITCFLSLSDTAALIGTSDGRLYYESTTILSRCDSILFAVGNSGFVNQFHSHHPIMRIGWMDKIDGKLFVLTDSLLYSVPTDLHSATIYALPLRSGERVIAASFPDPYTGFLLTNSERRFDTLASDGTDTALLFDTSFIYRSLDGGTTWKLILQNNFKLTDLCFTCSGTGFSCGAEGRILFTDDTGSRWVPSWTATGQGLREISFVNLTTGYAAGDSGIVLFTKTARRWWQPSPPEPLFTDPGTTYTGVAFPDGHSVFVVSYDRAYRSAIRSSTHRPNLFWAVPSPRPTLSVSVRPNPTTGVIYLHVRDDASDEHLSPLFRICDLSGNSFYESRSMQSTGPGEWTAEVDLSSAPPGPCAVIVTLGETSGSTKFFIQH